MDGFESKKGVTVIAATNRMNVLDPALTRGGRLCNNIKISTLDTDTRKKIINEYCQKKELPSTFTDKILNNTNENFSPANLISLLEQITEDHYAKTLTVTQVAITCRNFKKTHGMDKVSNKQRTNEEIESSRGGSWQTSTPTRSPYTKLNDASCDSGYFSGCSTSTNSYHTF